jgi:hypothetical protein
MHLFRVTRVIVLTVFLFFSTVCSCLFLPLTQADPLQGEKTFYLTDVLSSEALGDFFTVPVSESPPVKTNDSDYPPQLVTSSYNGLLPTYSFNFGQWTNYFSMAWLIYLLGDYFGDYGLSEEEQDLYGDLLSGLELLLPNPFRIVETYDYQGDQEAKINGNVYFDLYFSSEAFPHFSENDQVNVGLYSMNPESMLPLPKQIQNTTVNITSSAPNEIHRQTISLENVDYTLKPGYSLLFSVEIIPGNRTITSFIEKERPLLDAAVNVTLDWLGKIAESTGNEKLQDVEAFIDELKAMAEEYNITRADAADVFNSVLCSSLVYDSTIHPSSITLPFTVAGEITNEETQVYYLHRSDTMDNERPTTTESVSSDLSTTVQWTSAAFSRSRVLKTAVARLYISYQDLNLLNSLRENLVINVSLYENDNLLDSAEIQLEKTTFQQLLQPTDNPFIFPFTHIENKEIPYGHHLTLKVGLKNTSRPPLFQFHRNAQILFDAADYPSTLTVTLGETEYIKFDKVKVNPADEKIVPGNTITYTMDVINTYADDITFSTTVLSGNISYWDITVPESIQVNATGSENVSFIITSTSDSSDLYGEKLQVLFVGTGRTGRATYLATPEISEDAVEYDIEVQYPEGKTIRHGESGNYTVTVENLNTGKWPDTYTIRASSQHDWEVKVTPSTLENVPEGETRTVIITQAIPRYTSVTSDKITVTITSEESLAHGKNFTTTFVLTTTVEGPTILESFYHWFETTAKDLGLTRTFGSYAPHVLAAIIFMVLFFIIIIIVALLTVKDVRLICLDRIREISFDDTARFQVTVKNPSRKRTRHYLLSSRFPGSSSLWTTLVTPKELTLSPGESQTVEMMVTPSTGDVQSDDWVEAEFVATTAGRKRAVTLKTMTMVKKEQPELAITNVFHWPKSFHRGERVVTSLNVENASGVSARNVAVVLYVNDKQKNKVEDINIPGGGYADIRLPWIAKRGRNEVRIVVQ